MEHLSKSKAELYKTLSSAKQRRKRGLFIVEGEKAAGDFMELFEPEVLILGEGKEKSDIVGKCDPGRLRSATARELKELSGFVTPSDVIAIFRMPQEEALPEKLDSGELYLMLDGVRDPGNFGSILRTADWFGIHTVFASPDCVDLYNPKVIQATMGSLRNLKVYYTPLGELADRHPELPVIGTLLEGDNIYSLELPEGGFIVMGNEGQGITPEMRHKVNCALTIPPYDTRHGESLNVAAATAVVISEFRARRMRGR